MAFEYQSESGLTLTPDQEKLLDVIENLDFPYGGIAKLKDLRKKSKLKVEITDNNGMNESWKDYVDQYTARHDQFYSTLTGHRHQGEIGDRRDYAYLYELYSRYHSDELQPPQPILGIYNRTYRWWTGIYKPKVGLIKDNIEDYARKRNISPDIVFGFVFIQQMIHAYYDAFNSMGFPSMLELEYPFAEFGMLSFIDSSPDIRFLLPEAIRYTVAQIGTRPKGFGFGAELFDRTEDDAPSLIRRYRDVSNWMEPRDISNPNKYNNGLLKSSRNYFEKPTDENAERYYKDIIGVLDIDWTEPIDPLQPALGQKGKFDEKVTE